jgi:hypothetical protein
VTPVQAERRISRACAIFSAVDSFVMLRGVDGPGAARQFRGGVAFRLNAIGVGLARQDLDPAWTLPVIRGASGAFISDGTLLDPAGRRSRPVGPPLNMEITVTGRAYRATALPAVAGAPGGPQLVNLDPSQPTAIVTPFPVALWPGYAYPFPGSPSGYSIVRGAVLRGPAGAGVGKAQVNATAATGNWSDAYLTDGTGQWVFVIPDAQAGAGTVTARDPAGKSATTTVTVTASTTIAAPVLIPT